MNVSKARVSRNNSSQSKSTLDIQSACDSSQPDSDQEKFPEPIAIVASNCLQQRHPLVQDGQQASVEPFVPILTKTNKFEPLSTRDECVRHDPVDQVVAFDCRVIFQDDKSIVKPRSFDWYCCAPASETIFQIGRRAMEHFGKTVDYLSMRAVLALDAQHNIVSASEPIENHFPATIIITGAFVSSNLETRAVKYDIESVRDVYYAMCEAKFIKMDVSNLLTQLDSSRAAPHVLMPRAVQETEPRSSPRNVERITSDLRDLESFAITLFKHSLVPLHYLSQVLIERADGPSQHEDREDFFYNRFQLDPQALITKNLTLLGIRHFQGHGQLSEQDVVRPEDKLIANLLFRMNNLRNDWFHFAYLDMTDEQVQSELQVLLDTIAYLIAFVISQNTVPQRTKELMDTFQVVCATRNELLRRNAVWRRALAAMALGEHKREALVNHTLVALQQMMRAASIKDRQLAEQFVLTHITPYLHIHVPSNNNTGSQLKTPMIAMSEGVRSLAMARDPALDSWRPSSETSTTIKTQKQTNQAAVAVKEVQIVDIDVESDRLAYFQDDKLFYAVLTAIDPDKILRAPLHFLAWRPLSAHIANNRIVRCFHCKHPSWQFMDAHFVSKNEKQDAFRVVLHKNGSRNETKQFVLSHAFVSPRVRRRHEYIFSRANLRVLYNAEQDQVFVLGLPVMTGRVVSTYNGLHNVEVVDEPGAQYVRNGMRVRPFRMPVGEFVIGDVVNYSLAFFPDKDAWKEDYRSIVRAKPRGP